MGGGLRPVESARETLDRVVAGVSADRVRANLARFGHDLRAAGVPLGSGQLINLVEALAVVEVSRQREVYFASRATTVTRPEQVPAFDAAFARFWRELAGSQPLPVEAFLPEMIAPPIAGREPAESDSVNRADGNDGGEGEEDLRTLLAVEGTEDEATNGDAEDLEAPPEDVVIFSAREVLRDKDFAQFTAAEAAEARRIIEGMTWRLGSRETRRREAAVSGRFIDYRRTLRGSMAHGGVPIDLRHRRRRERMRPLVLICDISGSMDRYSRLLLRFVHALEHGLDGVEVFVFGTRLTRITRELRRRDVDLAIQEVAASVEDWSGGTRIGDAVKTFNFRWSRRVLRSGATVVLISDGWDRGEPELLGREMARLQRSCRRLVWLNPLLGAPGYQPLTQGMRAALPYTDHFLPVHNLASLAALAELLGSVRDTPPLRRHVPIPPARRG
ncbi:MAG: Carbon monoxide oxidation accessory protein CoxE [uncultured Thermomicrobiales bacterium]|uniref:Carbon monoxide oxidation accessory protein CoxE n=1 Tax=uncultured Thermomicrobiales bacterium TaxID=1645740 RepID=A0A6J4UZZ6_9BACT|nr:MAG: Carbon monoxide oxidation accessory protein CoxE [uncultured Thermomicrobiales bacterium]